TLLFTASWLSPQARSCAIATTPCWRAASSAIRKSDDATASTLSWRISPLRRQGVGIRPHVDLRAVAEVCRTPDEAFEGLPGFPFEPRYREVDGLRLAHLDEGDGKPVVFFHGEPTWSYLWRKVIPPVRDAGYRCLAPDYA